VRINARATVPAGDEVRLGQIASISGTDARTAERLAETVVLAKAQGTQKVKAESILMAVIAQHGTGGVASRLQVSGAAVCDVSIAGSSITPLSTENLPHEKPSAMAALSAVEAPKRGDFAAPSNQTPPKPTNRDNAARPAKAESNKVTLASLLTAKLLLDNECDIDDLRITFETITPWLDSSVPANHKWQFRPLTRATLGTLQFETQLLEGTHVVQKINIQAKVLKRTEVLVAAGAISRGDTVTRNLIKHEEAWLDRKLPTLMTRDEDVIGMELVRSVSPGAYLDQRDLKPVIFASKNELITVLYHTGSLKVEMKGRATQSGKFGDMIGVRNETTGETYQAVLVAKGRATVGSPDAP